jgi:hypothetical protein
MKKLATLLALSILFFNYSNAQCKKVDIAKLVQLRTLEDAAYKKAMEALGFTEDKNLSLVKNFNRECAINGATVKESISKMVESSEDFEEITLSYFIKDKSTYEILKKQVLNNKNYTAQKNSDKSSTNYKSKNDYIIFTETDNEFQINISNSF